MAGWILAAVLGCVAAGLGIKVRLMRKAARELVQGLKERKDMETNTLVDISSRDRAMRKLAAALNRDLALLREKRRQYQQGDLELKAWCPFTGPSRGGALRRKSACRKGRCPGSLTGRPSAGCSPISSPMP